MKKLSPKPVLTSSTRGDLIADALRKSILSGELRAGSQLIEMRLAAEFGVSRGPLREAIRTLAEEGLVVNKAYTGSYVASLSSSDLIDALNVRIALESLALKLCWPHRGEEFRQVMTERFENLQAASETPIIARQVRAELDFHSVPFEFCNNGLLQNSWKQLAQQIQLGFSVYRVMPMAKREIEWHQVYYDVALGDDLDAMIKEVEKHIRGGIYSIKRYADERRQPSSNAGGSVGDRTVANVS
jgi:DNA-binding GntR family transcriptional regulator